MANITAAEYARVKRATSQYTDAQKQEIVDAYRAGDVEKARALSSQYSNQSQTSSTPTKTSTNTPTTPTTPTVAETPTVKTSTPTTPTTPTPKAEETVVSTDSEIKQEWRLKPLTQEYYNQTSDEAINKIKDNLNTYKQTNPEYFRSYEDFKKNFSYDARNEEQKNALDTWYRWYEDGLWLAATPTADLYTQYQDGNLSANQLESLRISNPTKYAELQTQINKWNIIAAYDDDKSGTTTGTSIQDMAYQMMVQTFNQFMNGDNTSGASQFFRDYEDKMNDPEMLWLSDKCTEVQEEMENIQSDLDSIKKSVEAEYEGTWASRAKINAIISDRSYELQLQLRTLNSEYNKYATQYNNRMNQYQNEFSLQLQEYQIQQQTRQQQMQELWFAMDLMNFETNEQKAQREWDYWVKQQEYTNWNINSKDYDTRYKAALKSVQNLLSQYEGIPMQRSAEQMAQDVLKAIDNGSDLGTELTKINKQIQNKPEYKKLYNDTYGKSNDISYQTFKLWDKEYIVYNNELMSSEDFNKKYWGKAEWSTWEAKPYDIVDSKVFDTNTMMSPWYNTLGSFLADPKNADKKNWGWCGAFVNRYLKSIWVTTDNYYDDNLDTKLNSVNSSAPTVWSIAVFDYGHITEETGQNHGHVWIVTKVYSDWSFDVIESNFKWDKIIWERKNINPKSTTCKGFFDPSQPPAWSQQNTNSNTQTFVSWSIEWVPLAYERAVKNLVPAALQNSDAEREALNTIITNSYNGWIDQSEIALTFMGFDIKNEEDKKLALDLVNTVRTLSTETQEWIVQTISDLMNQGNYTKAIQTVENAVSQQAKAAWNYVSELSVKNTINKSNDLYDTITGLKDSPVWVLTWTMQDWLWKYASKDAKNIQSKISLLENSLDIKDKETAQRILPQLTDTPDVFMAKLQNLGNNMMIELNWWRTIYWLPELTTDALTNYSKRVDLYKWWNAGDTWYNPGSNTTTTNSSTAPTGNWYTPIVSWATWNTNTTVNVGGYDFPSTF